MLADPTRVRIVLTLRGGELPVNTIAAAVDRAPAAVDRAPAAVDRAPAAVSQHLAKLRLARIVAGRLVTDAIHQAEHALGQPRHHQTTTTGPA
jgi:DNA-binding transcriptional ArsR family regulator